jgi:2,5-diketo-D-gluconate reductase A
MNLIELNNGQRIPQLGLGVYKVGQDIAVNLIKDAVAAGYRRIDTAALYDNEVEVGQGVRACGLDRSEIYVTTKIWNDRHGYDNALKAIDESLSRLNIDYIDMLLIHWPVPKQDLYVETWRAFEIALESGKVRGIGVSNFHPNHLQKLLDASDIPPALNQVELHPFLQQNEVRAFNAKFGVATESWSPLGRGRIEGNEVLESIAVKHQRSVAQVVIRWHIQLGNLVIPKTVSPARLTENIAVFDFELDREDLVAISGLESGMRTGPNPDEF